ncbi:FISUMP domain-containing protein [Dysgonomonas sp. GY617]|uniref:FISUMP domain-containing protein n=1 Tax=Dysgonomonas sp. GY617 TaxID=2780420 RepID=UPI001883A48C|nr:FISUMP domain-containing protein [Dysgonomonas sp. GY617]MBF0576002.1 hypothetical protein [Dysgonomonas sp. GY617]
MNKIKKTSQKIYSRRWLLSVLFGLFLLVPVHGQVSIGDAGAGGAVEPQEFSILELISNKSGLRLPHLTTVQRDNLQQSSAFDLERTGKGVGLTIFNISTGCVDYWNGSRWIPLCQGNNPFLGGDCADTNFSVGGGTITCTITDPDCSILGDYSFTVIQGSDYTELTVLDAGTGQFSLSFAPNDWASSRTAIVMVTSPCGTSSIFVYTQDGDSSGCGITTVPDILTSNGASLCVGGMVYLYLNGLPDATTNTFIWVLNGQVVGTGNSLVATRPGKYTVYGDKLGCTNSKSITVSYSSTIAPDPVNLIVIGNGGVICGPGGSVQLVTTPPASGTVVWYKDGQKATPGTDYTINGTSNNITVTRAGEWFAVVEDGGCSSRFSDAVTVTDNSSSTPVLPGPPVMRINGVTSGWSACRGGSLFLEVDGTMDPTLTYSWYADNTLIGTGSGLVYNLPSGIAQVVIRLRVTGGSSACPVEALAVEPISPTQAPHGIITPGGTVPLCGGSAILTAQGGDSYRWFRDGQLISGQSGASLTVTTPGSYSVQAISSGGCQGQQSGAVTVILSDFGTASWGAGPTTVVVGENKTYTVNLDFVRNATYNWSVTGGGIITASSGNSAAISFPVTGTTDISCEVKNDCGEAIGSPLSLPVIVGTGCKDANITGYPNGLTRTVRAGSLFALSMTIQDAALMDVQWYLGPVGSGTLISGAASLSYSFTAGAVGTYNYYAVVTPTGAAGCASATSKQFTVTVTPDLSILPKGNGGFFGKTCFDVAKTNSGGDCGDLSARTTQRTDFENRTSQDTYAGTSVAPYSGVQVYTYKAVGTVSNVRFYVDDPTGEVIESITPVADYTGTFTANSLCKVTVAYKESLKESLVGLNRTSALKVTLYVVYSNAGVDTQLPMVISLQDCACCGAKTTRGGWLNFMCHNLGADENLLVFTPNVGLYGDLYQWGRPQDGHELRNSDRTSTLATNNTATAPAAVVGKFITISSSPFDWRSGGGNTSRWGNGTQDENVPKAENDPCPAGWKVPSQKQWASIFRGGTTSGAPSTASANTWTWNTSGYKVGDALFLPAGGYRERVGGALSDLNSFGYYWSSTVNGTNSYRLLFTGSTISPAVANNRSYGYSIRCVSE